MASEKRAYVQRARVVGAAQTRASILAAARELIPQTESGVGVDEIARRAGVAVQSVYDHFGSKGGLLMAVVEEAQRSAGLYDAFGRVFRSPDGETALRRMIGATFAVWHGAWPYIEFMLRSHRVDPVVKREVAIVDASRLAHLWAICRRLQDEERIRGRRSASWAADQAFALTHPVVYEELAVRRGWTLAATTTAITAAVVAAVLEPGSTPVRSPAPDWPALQAAATVRAQRSGKDSGDGRGRAASKAAVELK